MSCRLAIVAACLLFTSSALASPGANLVTSITPPSNVYVYQMRSYTVLVSNVGNQNASSCSVAIQLPATHTSPQVYVLGDLGSRSASCSQSGTVLNCSLGTIRKSQSASVFFEISLPDSSAPLVVTATAASPSEPVGNQGNNSASHTASLIYYTVAMNAPRNATNRHCTGQGLTAFYECELFPSSISSHDTTFNADGSISIAGEPDYGGAWSVSGAHLTFSYFLLADPGAAVAEFSGDGVVTGGPNCYEGLTRFPDGAGGYSPYVAPYEVCLE